MADIDIKLDGAANFRDFGGYPTKDGRIVQRRRLFRSDTLNALTASDFERLAQLGLRVVCDLRSKAEREHYPTKWPEDFVPETLLIDLESDLRSGDASLIGILKADPTENGALALMNEVYRSIPHTIQRYLPDLFAKLGQEDGTPLVVHCTAGKDRTGVASAVILLALGVNKEDVFHDYLLTNQFKNSTEFESSISQMTERMLGRPLPHAAVRALTAVHESYLDVSISAIEAEYGSFDSYLKSAGIDASLLGCVKARLLQD
jgi:protein-tyrosine phosphatase